jgi:hypothetical protein
MKAKLVYKVIGVAAAGDEALANEFRDEIAQRLEHLDQNLSFRFGKYSYRNNGCKRH